MWSQLALSLHHGDVYLYLMLGLAWIGVLILIERFVMINFVFRIDFKKFLTNLKKLVQSEDIDRAVSLCKKAGSTSLPHISLRALEAAESDPSTVRGVIEEETIDFLPRVEARLNVLPAIATISLLVGVLGTVDNLWAAFHSIDILDTAEKQASLAGGIATSLTHTSMGLLISIILLAGHQFLKSGAVKLVERIHYGIAVLTNLLAPAETASFIPAMGIPTAPAPAAAEAQAEAPKPAAVAEAQDDSFDDASVEDIKDEEEII